MGLPRRVLGRYDVVRLEYELAFVFRDEDRQSPGVRAMRIPLVSLLEANGLPDMALITETKNSTGTYRKSASAYGKDAKYELIVRKKGFTEIKRLEPEHRVKPHILCLNPTSRGQQSSRIGTYYKGGQLFPMTGEDSWDDYVEVNSDVLGYFSWAPTPTLQTGKWITPLRNKIKDTDVSLGETVFEFRETVRAFCNFAKAIKNWYEAYKAMRHCDQRVLWRIARGGPVRRRRSLPSWTLKDVSGAYLGFSFGIKPTAEVAMAAWMQLHDKLADPDFFVAKKFTVSVGDDATADLVSPNPGAISRLTKVRVKERVVCYVAFKPSFSPGVTMGNPLEVAWELVPLSWLVDVFIPIGNTLKSLDALKNVTGVVGTVSTNAWTERSAWYTPGSITRSGSHGSQKGTMMLIQKQMERSHTWGRTLLTGVPPPPFPRWSPSPSWRSLSYALAILHQYRSTNPD